MVDQNNASDRLWSLSMAHYGIYMAVVAIVIQTVVQMTGTNSGSSPRNKIRMGICLATLVINFVASLHVFSLTTNQQHSILPERVSQTGNTQHNDWETIVFRVIFIFTGLLALYLAFSMLLPEWCTWSGFAIICIIVTIVEGHKKLQSMIKWPNEIFVYAITFLIKKFMELISKPQTSLEPAT